MPGTQVFTYANIGKETTRGTPVAPTRKLYATASWPEDIGLNLHETENRGTRTPIVRATQTTEDVTFDLDWSNGISYDELPILFSQLKGGVSGTGASANKTWTNTPSMTAANSPEAYSLDLGDDTQNWRLQYAQFATINLSAAKGELTMAKVSGYAQRAVKTAKATPADSTAVRIPGDIWQIKFATTAAGLAAATAQLTMLQAWELEIDTGLRWRHYLDGNLYGGQHVETAINATLKLTVESDSRAVSQFYDKWKAQTLDFIRLLATGPSLGSGTYSATIDLPVLYKQVTPLSGEDEGVNLYEVEAALAYDPTSTASIAPVTICSLTALP